MTRQILVCVAGMTPQVITETLYVLTQVEHQPVHEVRVITTLRGREQIIQAMFAPGQGQFYAFCQDFGIDPQSIKFDASTISLLQVPDGRVLTDIRTKAENECAANQICRIVQALTDDDDCAIHASIAGGRKTLGIYLTIAMQLFARPQDRISHVLVTAEFEQQQDFFYKPPIARQLMTTTLNGETKTLSTDQAEISLADIDIIRLRGLIAPELAQTLFSQPQPYSVIVQQTQARLNFLDSVHDLLIQITKRTLYIADHAIVLTERELFIYLLFAYARKHRLGNNGYLDLENLSYSPYLDVVFRIITTAKGIETGIEDYQEFPKYNFLSTFLGHKQTGIDPQELRQSFFQIKSKIKHRLEQAEIPACYHIDNYGSYGEARYGIALAPERIYWN